MGINNTKAPSPLREMLIENFAQLNYFLHCVHVESENVCEWVSVNDQVCELMSKFVCVRESEYQCVQDWVCFLTNMYVNEWVNERAYASVWASKHV